MNCNKLEKNVINALSNLNVAADVEKCSDILKIAEAGILVTPGLGIDGKVISQGRVLTVSDIENILKKYID